MYQLALMFRIYRNFQGKYRFQYSRSNQFFGIPVSAWRWDLGHSVHIYFINTLILLLLFSFLYTVKKKSLIIHALRVILFFHIIFSWGLIANPSSSWRIDGLLHIFPHQLLILHFCTSVHQNSSLHIGVPLPGKLHE